MTSRKFARIGRLSILVTVLFASRALAQAAGPTATAPWERVASVPDGNVFTTVFDGAHPGVAFAGTGAAYIYRSVDGGTSWKPVKVGTPSEEFRAIAVSPTTPGTVYAYSSDSFYSGLGTLYRSVDDGRTWKPTPNQPSSAVGGAFFAGVGRGIAIDPSGRILVLTDAYSGILRSADGGDTWTNPLPKARAYGLSKDPEHRGVLWAAGYDRSTRLGTVWKSTDFGATWTAQTPDAFNPAGPLGVSAYAIAVQPGTGLIFASWSGTDPNTFEPDGGMVVSVDGGQTWTARDDGLLHEFAPGNASGAIAFDPENPDTIFLSVGGFAGGNGALTGGGLYRSRDHGRSWEPLGTRLRTLSAFGFWVRPAMRGYAAALLAGSPGLFVSMDHGDHWNRSDVGLDDGSAALVADDGIAPGGYYAATGFGLFHSTDGAASWTRISTWNGPEGSSSVAIDGNSPNHTVYAPSRNHVWRSTNAGHSWTDVTPPAPAATLYVIALADPRRADHIYVETNDGTIFHTRNAGRSWSSVLCGAGTAAGDAGSANLVLVANGSTAELYVPMVSGLWIADTGATVCTPARVQPLPGGYITSIVELGSNPTALLVSGLAASGPPLVMRTVDGGATYQPVDSLPSFQNAPPWNLASSPNQRLGAASFAGDTISISRDGGANWTTQPDVFLDISAGFSTLFATQGKVFWGDDGGALYVAPDAALR